jgi:hypothetical protein
MRPDPDMAPQVSRPLALLATGVLVAFLVLVVLGPAHLDRDALTGHDANHCATCAAVLVLSTAVVLLAVMLHLGLGRSHEPRLIPVDRPVVARRGLRLASPRAPPSFD